MSNVNAVSRPNIEMHQQASEPLATDSYKADGKIFLTGAAGLRNLAHDVNSTSKFKTAVKQQLEAGTTHAQIIDCMAGTAWRYKVLNSGTSLFVEHLDVLTAEFRGMASALLEWKSSAHKEKWHESIVLEIKQFEYEYSRLCSYLVPGDELPSLDDAIDAIFTGSGYMYDGSITESHEACDWNDDDDEEE